ncbi:MAG: tetratricopeptide repeat protein [Chloroflexota bacterium]|nr:tetratricopeptide repeat protein [Lentimicrobium sp.]
MKTVISVLFFSFICFLLNAQTVIERVTDKTCDCISAFNDLQTMNDSVDACTTRSLGQVVAEGLNGEKVDFSMTGMNELVSKVAGRLFDNCWKVRMFVVNDMKSQFYKESENVKANEYYQAGNVMLEAADYEKAISSFEKAVKSDPKFIYAIDHLAICYRRQNKFEKAVKIYKQSLDIFPQGDVALMNMAVCYNNLKKYEEELECYSKLKWYHPLNPEGYYGMGTVFYDAGNYPQALDNFFTALHLYTSAGNEEYKADAEKMINFVYTAMDKSGQLDEFRRIAKEHNVNVNEKTGDKDSSLP